jgi:hypothetical protein
LDLFFEFLRFKLIIFQDKIFNYVRDIGYSGKGVGGILNRVSEGGIGVIGCGIFCA